MPGTVNGYTFKHLTPATTYRFQGSVLLPQLTTKIYAAARLLISPRGAPPFAVTAFNSCGEGPMSPILTGSTRKRTTDRFHQSLGSVMV